MSAVASIFGICVVNTERWKEGWIPTGWCYNFPPMELLFPFQNTLAPLSESETASFHG